MEIMHSKPYLSINFHDNRAIIKVFCLSEHTERGKVNYRLPVGCTLSVPDLPQLAGMPKMKMKNPYF